MTENTLVGRMEQAKASRPELAARVDAAAALVREHLSHREEQRIRGRVTLEGTTWSVLGSKGNRYTVTHSNAGGWGCTCPDCRNRGVACKHVLAVKALMMAIGGEADTTPAPAPSLAVERARRDARSEELIEANRRERLARRPRERVEEV